MTDYKKACFQLLILIQIAEMTTAQDATVRTLVGLDANFSLQLSGFSQDEILFIRKGESDIMTVFGGNHSYTSEYKDRMLFTGIVQQRISFVLKNVTLRDAGKYVAKSVTTIFGEQTLIVKASPTKPLIVELNIAESGSSYRLNCTTNSSSAPPGHGLVMTAEWKKNGTGISPGGQYILQGTQLTITNLSYGQDNGTWFTCLTYEDQQAKSNESDAHIIDVKYGPDNINLSPSSAAITEKETNQIIVRCTADCNPPCRFQWSKEGGSSFITTNQSMVINSVSKVDGGRYTCTIKNNVTGRYQIAQTSLIVIYGPASDQVALSPPESHLKVEENVTVNINCSADCYPLCNYTWTGPQGFYQTGTPLLRVMDRDKGGTYICTATNQENTGKTASANVTVMVFYGPGSSVNLGAISSTLSFDLLQKVPNITCSATCNPPCDYRWYKDGTFYSSGAILSVGTAEKCTRGNYICQAYNNFLNLNRSSSTYVNITVFYGAGIVNLSAQDSNIVNENLSANFHCHVDSNPLPTITWMRDDNNTVLMTESGVLHSQFRIESAQCLDMGNYSCTAYNGIWTPVKEILQLFVKCHPRTDYRLSLETKIYGKRRTPAFLRYTVIAYPHPSFTWMFNGNGSEARGLPVSVSQHDNGQQSEINFTSLGIDEFGNYSVVANNSVYPSAKEVFEIIPADVPDVPSNVTVIDLTTNSVTIQWVAGYSGGPKQTFHIVASAGEFTRSVTESDPGYGKNGTAALESLLPGTKYSIYITAKNSVGESNATEAIIIETPEESRPVPVPVVSVSAVVGGIVAGVAVILLAVIAMFLWRRHQHHRQHSDEGLNKELEERGRRESGLVDNPVYDSSGTPPGDSINSIGMGVEYAAVAKPKKKAEDPSSLYAQVDRNHKKGNKGGAKGKSEKTFKGGAKGKGGKNFKGDIYEDAILSGQNSTPETEYENSKNVETGVAGESLYENPVATLSNFPMANKDGLLYADIMLDPPTIKNGNPVIRGIENRTEYAEIAYGKRGNPLPDIDETEKTS